MGKTFVLIFCRFWTSLQPRILAEEEVPYCLFTITCCNSHCNQDIQSSIISTCSIVCVFYGVVCINVNVIITIAEVMIMHMQLLLWPLLQRISCTSAIR